jgi:hypothetical protein
VDSIFAAQATATLSSRWSAVLQVMAQQQADDRFRPEIEWANVKFQATPNLALRVGRIGLPIFLLNDTRNIHYSMAWARTPIELYSIAATSHSDGADLTYRFDLPGASNTLQLVAGEAKQTQGGPLPAEFIARDLFVASNTYERGALTVRATFVRGHIYLDPVDELLGNLALFGDRGRELAEHYVSHGRPAKFYGIGSTYDPSGWFVTAEWGRLRSDSAFGKCTAWYLGGGIRTGAFTPYVAFSTSQPDAPTSDPGIDLATVPAELAPDVAALNGLLNGVLGAIPDQSTITAGVRWDFARNFALKLQYDDMDIAPGSNGVLVNLQPGFVPGGRVRLVSLTLDFVL